MLPPGTDLEPKFAAPHLSSYLQDFWGRWWNLVGSNIMRSDMYDPVQSLWGSTAAVMASFLVSGLMHDVIFFYMSLEPSTGEVGLFFVLHGICTTADISAKKQWSMRGMRPLQPALTVPLTLGFVLGTSWWLFMPPIVRAPGKETDDLFLLLKGVAET
ncbi:putative long-chain-alcohol O-fatty-acyltransferase 5 [Wolffia australiana]